MTDPATVTDALLPCPFCGGAASWRQIRLGGTGSSGMEQPDITIGCAVDNFWLKPERTEEWKQGKGTYSIEPAAKAALIKIWNTRTSTEALRSENAELREAAQFLCDRLVNFESDLIDDSTASEYHGHVEPAKARLQMKLDAAEARQALADTPPDNGAVDSATPI